MTLITTPALERPRRPRRRRSSATALACAAIALGLTGCGGGATVPAGTSATELLDAHVADTGVVADPGSLDCGNGTLTAGASLDCTLTSGGVPLGLTAKVTSVDGGKVGLDVATTARPIPADALGQAVATQAGKQLGAAIDGATCSGDLPPEVGRSTTCTLTSGPEKKDVNVTVTAVDGGQVSYAVAGAA